MTIKQVIEKGAIMLKLENVESPKLKARLLIQFILQKPRQYIIVHDMEELSLKKEKEYFKAIDLLKKGKPLEHITHQKEFMKLNFFVNEDVLIPRQDTETLVEEVIKLAKKSNAKNILDLCTGSGAIAVSLAKYLPNVKITAIDISHKAIQVAKKNAIYNHVENQIIFLESNLFENLTEQKYDIIVSNPPYISWKELKKLDKQVKNEPVLALDGGEDGLNFYRRIVSSAYEYLKYNGYLCFEIGYNQKQEVMNIIEKENKYVGTYCLKDLYDKDRVIVTKVN